MSKEGTVTRYEIGHTWSSVMPHVAEVGGTLRAICGAALSSARGPSMSLEMVIDVPRLCSRCVVVRRRLYRVNEARNLRLLGLTNEGIASRLSVSLRTVRRVLGTVRE
jgi:hypothetical protein